MQGKTGLKKLLVGICAVVSVVMLVFAFVGHCKGCTENSCGFIIFSVLLALIAETYFPLAKISFRKQKRWWLTIVGYAFLVTSMGCIIIHEALEMLLPSKLGCFHSVKNLFNGLSIDREAFYAAVEEIAKLVGVGGFVVATIVGMFNSKVLGLYYDDLLEEYCPGYNIFVIAHLLSTVLCLIFSCFKLFYSTVCSCIALVASAFVLVFILSKIILSPTSRRSAALYIWQKKIERSRNPSELQETLCLIAAEINKNNGSHYLDIIDAVVKSSFENSLGTNCGQKTAAIIDLSEAVWTQIIADKTVDECQIILHEMSEVLTNRAVSEQDRAFVYLGFIHATLRKFMDKEGIYKTALFELEKMVFQRTFDISEKELQIMRGTTASLVWMQLIAGGSDETLLHMHHALNERISSKELTLKEVIRTGIDRIYHDGKVNIPNGDIIFERYIDATENIVYSKQ